MPGLGRIVHVRDESGQCVAAMVTKVWNPETPDYVQATAFLDGVNDHPATTGGRQQGLWFCSSITPSQIACGGTVHHNHTEPGGGIAPADNETPPPTAEEYMKWEYPFQRWHWPAKTDPS